MNRNVTYAFGYCTMGTPSIVLRYYSKGNLKAWLADSKNEFNNVLPYFNMIKDICFGIKALHSKNIAHCNLNLENILLEKNEVDRLTCVISNLSRAQTVQAFNYPDYDTSSVFYVAPEVIRHFKSETNTTEKILTSFKGPEIGYQLSLLLKRDIYSLSIIIYNVLTKREAVYALEKEDSVTLFYTLYSAE